MSMAYNVCVYLMSPVGRYGWRITVREAVIRYTLLYDVMKSF